MTELAATEIAPAFDLRARAAACSVIGWSALMVASGITFAAFSSAGEPWGRINDAITAASGLAVIPAVAWLPRVLRHGRAPSGDRRLESAVTVTGVFGGIGLAAGTCLFMANALSLDEGLLAGKVGSALVAGWVGAISLLLRRDQALSTGLASAGVAAAAGTIGAIVLLDMGSSSAALTAASGAVALLAAVSWGLGTARRAVEVERSRISA
jgi:hypothetical protein